MSRWTNFLNSLATRGGAIFILCVIVLLVDAAAFTMYLRHDLDGHQLTDIASGSGAIVGALLIVLKGSSDTSTVTTIQPNGAARVSTSEVTNSEVTTGKTPADPAKP